MAIKGLDAWLTTDPNMEYDDTICFHCQEPLDETSKDPWVYEGFCSKECEQAEDKNKT